MGFGFAQLGNLDYVDSQWNILECILRWDVF